MITTVEARGVLCPVPIIRLARTAATLQPGSLIALLTDDPAAEHDVPAWCRLRGHTLVDSSDIEPDVADQGPGPSAAGALDPEPYAPNTAPGQARRHLIRLGPATVRGD